MAQAPSQAYAASVGRGDWQHDPAQQTALVELDRIHAALLERADEGLLAKLLRHRPAPPRGLYLWGGVGRGKTFLIDLFYEGLPQKELAAAGRTDVPLLRNGVTTHGLRATGARVVERPRRERGLGRGAEGDHPRSGWWGEGEGTIAAGRTDSPSPAGGGRWHAVPDEGGGKHRTHFHRFMRDVHAQLRAHAGERDPLAAIARGWGKRLSVLVLDECFVSDIGDAMLLGRLLERLFAEGVVLVTSSNTPPAELYKDGLQRARFLPAIALIQQHCAVLHLDSPTDYRLRALTRSPVYRQPLDAQSDAWLRERWTELSHGCPPEDGPLHIDGRDIAVRGLAEGLAWFDFDALCEGPRAAADYIEIARERHTVLLGGIPIFDTRLDAHRDDAARRFVTLIDELYDRHVNLVCTADAAPTALYGGQRLRGAFERTASRLIEMRSAEYLALEHRG